MQDKKGSLPSKVSLWLQKKPEEPQLSIIAIESCRGGGGLKDNLKGDLIEDYNRVLIASEGDFEGVTSRETQLYLDGFYMISVFHCQSADYPLSRIASHLGVMLVTTLAPWLSCFLVMLPLVCS